MNRKVKITVMGDVGVGKTSVVRQFTCQEYAAHHQPTRAKQLHVRAAYINERLYELLIVDLPPAQPARFPWTSAAEWREEALRGIRSSHAFVLVFDVTRPHSLQYVQRMRQEIGAAGLRDPPPVVVVVGNKCDLVVAGRGARGASAHPADPHQSSTSLHSLHQSNPPARSSSGRTREAPRPDLATIINKQWRCCAYVECSAKYNWHVVQVFREVMTAVDLGRQQRRGSERAAPAAPTPFVQTGSDTTPAAPRAPTTSSRHCVLQ